MSKLSPRLHAALRVIEDMEWHSSLELAKRINPSGIALAVGSTMADLRKKGYVIDSEYVGKTKAGNRIFKYRLIPEGQLDLGMKGIREENYG
jgi:hypothetical protein